MTEQQVKQAKSYGAWDDEDEKRLWGWAELARELLLDVAERGEVINYKLLWDTLEAGGQAPTPRGLYRNRTGSLLFRVSHLNKLNEEPLLTALVVLKETGEVSEGYEDGAQVRYGYRPSNIAAHARVERRKIARWVKG